MDSNSGKECCREGYMKKGDVVKFKNIVDAGDENVRMVLLEDSGGGRVLVEIICDMNIKPTYRYKVEELEVCGKES
jgi:hypothetical protein